MIPELPVKQITNNGTSTSYEIVIENSQYAYYYVSVGKVGNVTLSAVPDWFVLTPHEKLKLPYANFKGGDRLSFVADGSLNHWQVPAALAIDAIYRATFGSTPPKNVTNLFIDLAGKSRKYGVVGDSLSLYRDLYEFENSVNRKDSVSAATNLFDIATNPIVLETVFKRSKLQVGYIAFLKSAGKVIELELLTLIAPKVDVLAFEATYVSRPNPPKPNPTPTPKPPAPPSLSDNAAYVSEGAPYDKDPIAAGQTFTKKWTIKNTGNTTWGAGYSWTFDGTDQMGGANVAAPTVRPGESWGVVVTLKAPTAPRVYTGYWRMNGPRGKFGIRSYVQISVNAPAQPVWQGSMDSPVANATVQGKQNVSGWARDYTGKFPITSINIYVDGALVGNGVYGRYRSDPGLKSNVGWDYTWNTEKWAGKTVTVKARFYSGSKSFDIDKQVKVIYAVGQSSPRQSLFEAAYNRNGGAAKMGQPVEATFWAYNNRLRVQGFRGGSYGDCHIFDDEDDGKGAFVLRGAMRARYFYLGKADSILRAPRSDQRAATTSPYGTTGEVQDFERGHLVSSKFGLFYVLNQIDLTYLANGGSGGFLGFPKDDETNDLSGASGKRGYSNTFEGGHIWHVDSLGTFFTRGEIDKRYAAMLSRKSYLGFPIARDGQLTSVTGSRGWGQLFEGGVIHSNAFGTFAMPNDDIRRKYQSQGSENGPLGFAKGEKNGGTGSFGTHADWQIFENGTIQKTSTGTFIIVGEIDDKYIAQGGGRGPLGYATSDAYSYGGGKRQDFEGGSLTDGVLRLSLLVSITPTSVRTNDKLTATSTGAGPSATLTFQWKKNGVVIAGETAATLNLAKAGNGDRGDVISVEISATSEGSTVTASAQITVANSTPSLKTTAFNAAQNTASSRQLAGTDADGDALTYRVTTGTLPTGLTLSTSGLLAGTPTQVGSSVVTVEVADGKGGTGAAQITFVVKAAPIPPTLTPIITPAFPKTNDTLTVTPNGDAASYAYLWKKNGAVIAGENTATLDLAKAGNGDKNDVIVCEVTAKNANGAAATSQAQVTVVNSAPIAISSQGVVDHDAEKGFPLPAFDADGDALTYKRVGGPRNGVKADIRVDPTDGVTKLFYRSRKFYGGVDVIRFVVFDSSNKQSNESTLGIRVLYTPPPPVNRAPRAGDTSIDTYVDTTFIKGLLGSDPDGDAVTFRLVNNAKFGTSEIKRDKDGLFKLFYTSLNRFYGPDRVTYIAVDKFGKESNLATVKINFINRAPVAQNNRIQLAAGAEVSQYLFGTDEDGDALTFRLVNNPRYGRGEVKRDGEGKWRFYYRSLPDYVGPDQITFIAIDPQGKEPSVAAIDINVIRVSGANASALQSATAPSGGGS